MRLATKLASRGKRVTIVDLKDYDPGDAPFEVLKERFTDAYLSICNRSSKRD